MMEFQNESQAPVNADEILVIGLGGAGTNIVDNVTQNGLKDAKTLVVNADLRSLSASIAKNKIQLGVKVRRGLACGGDPELGLRAAQESESQLRDAIRGSQIVFLCVGLGGGTGSGAAPLITRIAREENAFVVVFATMPFNFEGVRRREQAELALNELAAISSALVTFDNGRMSELVAPDQSVHDAFDASNHLISRSINSISRIALYPGIVRLGLDDLISTLSSKRSRCLFGAGTGQGEGRVESALKMALSSPLIDQGKLLNTSEKVLVHICGGATTTMTEAQELMEGVVEKLNDQAQIFFGISIDETMNDEFSATIISSLPEEQVLVSDPLSVPSDEPEVVAPAVVPEPVAEVASAPIPELTYTAPVSVSTLVEPEVAPEPVAPQAYTEPALPEMPVVDPEPVVEPVIPTPTAPVPEAPVFPEPQTEPVPAERAVSAAPVRPEARVATFEVPREAEQYFPEPVAPEPVAPEPVVEAIVEPEPIVEAAPEPVPTPPVEDFNPPTEPIGSHLDHTTVRTVDNFKEYEERKTQQVQVYSTTEQELETLEKKSVTEALKKDGQEIKSYEGQSLNEVRSSPEPEPTAPLKRRFGHLFNKSSETPKPADTTPVMDLQSPDLTAQTNSEMQEKARFALPQHDEEEPPTLSSVLGVQQKTHSKPKLEPEGDLFLGDNIAQGELMLDGQPKGRFEGEDPNFHAGEDLDIPTFLRNMEEES